MQLVSRYLVSNSTVVVLDGTGNLTEYRKVYQRNIKIAKGIDNVINFEIKNHDQKPVSILNTYTPYVEKTVVVPEKDKHIESMLLFIYKDDSVKNE